MRGTYIGNNKCLIHPIYGGMMTAPADDFSITYNLMIQGCVEPELIQWINNNLKLNSISFDVGANIGFITLILAFKAGKEGRVHTFEPNPLAFEYLRDNVTMNYYFPRCTLNPVAAWSKDDEVKVLGCLTKFAGGSSFQDNIEPEFVGQYADSIKEELVRTITLDKYVEDHRVTHIDFIKVDVEGSEYQVFLGMERILKDRLCRNIIFELSHVRLGDDLNPLFDLLGALPAKFYELGKDGQEIEQPLSYLFYGPPQNVLMRL